MPDNYTPGTAVAVHSANMLADGPAFEHGQRVAKLFASSQLVPPHLRDKVADCFIALHMAQRLNEDPLIVLQNIYVVSGRAGWSAQYMIGRANRSGVFKGRINWRIEGKGDALSVTAYAKLADDGEEVSATATMAMAKAEGWTKNAKYQSMPEVMLRYRSATMLIRFYCPDVMLGIPVADELEDERAAGRMRDVTPAAPADAAPMTPFERAARGLPVIDADPQPAAADDYGVISSPAAAAPEPTEPRGIVDDNPPAAVLRLSGETLPYDDLADAARDYTAAIDACRYIKDKEAIHAANASAVETLRAAGHDVWRPV